MVLWRDQRQYRSPRHFFLFYTSTFLSFRHDVDRSKPGRQLLEGGYHYYPWFPALLEFHRPEPVNRDMQFLTGTEAKPWMCRRDEKRMKPIRLLTGFDACPCKKERDREGNCLAVPFFFNECGQTKNLAGKRHACYPSEVFYSVPSTFLALSLFGIEVPCSMYSTSLPLSLFGIDMLFPFDGRAA